MFLKSSKLSQFPNLIHGFTTRELGADYKKIAQAIDVPTESILTLKQIHSNKTHAVTGSQIPANESIEGDAMMTQQPKVVIGIRTADCVPIIVFDPKQKVVAAIHAGWRGVIAGVIENIIVQMQKEFKSSPDELVAVLGPALCIDCFEVGPEVAEKFVEKFGSKINFKKGKGDRWHPDLREGCVEVLKTLGIKEENLESLPYCTSCNNDLLFSYRKGDREERMLGFIGLMTPSL